MLLKNKKISFAIIIFLVGMFANNITSVNASSTSPVVYGTINAAYYTDYNNQSYLDIIYNMSLYISDFTSTNTVNGYYLTLLVGLTYPDGTTFWYQINLVSYKQSFNLQIIFLNSVTQSGWYTAQSYSYSTYGHDKAYYSSVEFDPPPSETISPPL